MREKNIRFLYMLITGICIAFIITQITPGKNDDHNIFIDYILAIVITFIVWEGNLRIDSWLNIKLPWLINPGKRILVQFFISMLFSSLGTYVPMLIADKFICVIPPEKEHFLTIISLAFGLVISIILLSIEIGSQFFKNWKKSLVEVEHYKTLSVQAQLQNLKDQVNPHFLFNNLSVLSSLVYQNQDKAVSFINQLSKVYRYILENRNNELVSVQEELMFIDSYIFLLKIRFDTNFNIEIKIDDESKNKLIPPMVLQMLIENTIKHNEVSESNPLFVKILFTKNEIVITNNIQLRTHTEPSTKTGLINIKNRYSYYSNTPIEITQNEKEFKVKLPILEKNECSYY